MNSCTLPMLAAPSGNFIHTPENFRVSIKFIFISWKKPTTCFHQLFLLSVLFFFLASSAASPWNVSPRLKLLCCLGCLKCASWVQKAAHRCCRVRDRRTQRLGESSDNFTSVSLGSSQAVRNMDILTIYSITLQDGGWGFFLVVFETEILA